jgi:hypothetical protein
MAGPAPADYHGAVSEFKRRLIEATLHAASGNRTHAARRLGLQRTYLLRLMRELRVAAPPPPERGRRVADSPPSHPEPGVAARASLPRGAALPSAGTAPPRRGEAVPAREAVARRG